MAVSILLVVLVSLSLANTVLLALETLNPPDMTASINPATSDSNQGLSFRTSNLELFGNPAEASVPVVVDAPETRLNLELQGVFIAEKESFSTAIIGEKSKKGQLYAIGDRLRGNASLAAVHEDHVLIKRGSKMERLRFSDSKFRAVASEQKLAAAGGPVSPDVSLPEAPEVVQETASRDPPAPGNKSWSRDATQDLLNEYRVRLDNDPQSVLGEIGVAPVVQGDARGYRVSAGAQVELQQAGLQPGDVILSVNGHPVGIVARDSALVDQVMAAPRVRIEVQRGSRRFFLTVPVPQQ